MKLIKPDFDRRLELAGVTKPVSRPVDIDQSQTGFANLRTLRIYRFEPGSTIDGHAEEDEVFVVVLAGSVDIELNDGDPAGDWRPYTLLAQGGACVAYLPPHSAYRLTPRTVADVAYARATLATGRPSIIFPTTVQPDADVIVLLEEKTYAQRLRLRLVRINAVEHDLVFIPVHEEESRYEALVHVRTEPPNRAITINDGDAVPAATLDSWDTVAIVAGERPAMRVEKGSIATALTVLAVNSIS